ncbi:MAG: LLM class F420-dependent oxidoreductase [Sphingomonadaceae bacterium]
MKLGITFPNIELGIDPDPIARLAQGAEGLGYHFLMCSDHVIGADLDSRPDWRPFNGSPPVYTIEDAFHEPLTLFGYLAAMTKRIELATGIVVLPQRQTVLLAKQVAEIDMLSRGRIRLGAGIGWNDVEYQSLGMDFHDRGQRSAEQIMLLRKLWTEPCVTFHGKWHTVEAAGINPLPSRPIPIWLGGTADVVLRRIATLADGWHIPSILKEEEIAEHLSRLFRYAEEAGRDPATIGIDGIIRMWGRTPEQCAESLAMWQRLGATHVTFNTEADSHRKRLPTQQVEQAGYRLDFFTLEERLEALTRFMVAAPSYADIDGRFD